ncbi:MAG: biotin carboxylase N-terminal domain-containing protein [Gammaproteobacteria bacterium]|nr:biotin carboxylase N-terminal domain-containing protein [Gammaproteobacteria bacterium]
MFAKVLIANRGAIARRVVRACRALGIGCAVVYAEADAGAPYLEEADEAWPLAGNTAAETYLNQQALLQCLTDSGADAVHPGYGFLAENAAFAHAVREHGAVFIGPSPHWLETMGDKIRARSLMAEHGFPVLPGSGALTSAAEAAEAAERIGYPLMLKPAAGGGGIGMQVVRDEQELARALPQARRVAEAAFGDGTVFLEACVERPRHVEIQLLGDGRGGAVHLYERDCSVQQRHRKIIEEAPAPGLQRAAVEDLARRAEQAMAELGYDNIGTLETLRGSDGTFGFIEMNTRIQVEHAVTEAVTGVDLVATQIALAAGAELPQRPELNGCAVEARVYAEDLRTGHPATGVLTRLRTPDLFGVRFETGYRAGQAVTPYYDPLIAKVIGHGASREQAIGRTLVGVRALEVQGVPSNSALLERVLQDERFLAGDVHTGFL